MSTNFCLALLSGLLKCLNFLGSDEREEWGVGGGEVGKGEEEGMAKESIMFQTVIIEIRYEHLL